MKESASNEEKKTKFLPNNNVHLYGFINDVRMHETESGRTAINLDVSTTEQWKDKNGESQTRRTYHDVVMFTDDKDTIAKFEAIGADCEANRANRGADGYSPKNHTVSVDAIIVNRENAIAGTEKLTTSIAFLANEDNVKTDVKQQEGELRNRADIVGNIGSIDLHEDKKFAVVSLANHYRPKGAKEQETWIDIRVDGSRKVSKEAYDALAKGDLETGDFIRVGGQIHNNRYDLKEGGTAYKNVLDLTTFSMIEKKAALNETAKEAPAQKAAEAPKAKTAAKETAEAPKAKADSNKKTKADSNKKKGVRMG